jgi:hypothetical protein
MDELQKLYDVLVREGKYTKSFDEFKVKWSQDQAYKDKVFDVVSRDGLYTKDKNSFFQKYSGATVEPKPVEKKKVTTESPSADGSLVSKGKTPEIKFQQPSVIPQRSTINVATNKVEPYVAPKQPQVEKEPTEEDYFTGAFGNVLRKVDEISPIGIGDFIDDMTRSVASGYRQGKSDEESFNLAFKGQNASYKDIQKFIDSKKNAEELKPSAEMQEYNKIYEKEGKGFWGVVKGITNNPSVFPEIIYSSIVRMATNTDALMAGGAAIGTGASIGATTAGTAGTVVLPVIGTVGGVGAGAVTGAAAALPYAFGLASSVVETGATFGELLTEELGGKEMTKENVKAILENPEKYKSIRNKAIARGIVIGTADALTGKLASSVGAKILSKSAAKSAVGAATKGAVTKATAAGAAIEGLGGSAGEAAARGAIGQEMDVSEIALEGLAELPGGIKSTIQARFAKPSYKVNGEKVSAEQVDDLITTMTPDELAKTKIEIKNDYAGREFKIRDKIITDNIKKQVKQANPELNEPSLNAVTDLEKELNALEGNKTQTGKDKAAAIRSQIKDIQENQLQEEAVEETVETQLKPKEDAIQEQATGQVPVQSETGVSETLAGRTPETGPEIITEETITTAQPQAEVEALRDVKSTAKALEQKVSEGLRFNAEFNVPIENTNPNDVAELYHKAKLENNNPELVEQVESLFKQSEVVTAEEVSSKTQEEAPKISAKEILNTFEKGSVIDVNEILELSKGEDNIVNNVLSKMKNNFNKIKISGKRPNEGAAFYNYNNKEIDINKNSVFWDNVDGYTTAGTIAHEYTHHLIQESNNKNEIEKGLQEIKDDLKNNPPAINDKNKSLYDFMVSENNSPQEILTYAVSDATIRPILAKYKDKLNTISNEVIGEDVITDADVEKSKQNETEQLQPERTGDGGGRRTTVSEITPLQGAPKVQGSTGPDKQLVSVAEKYAADNKIELKRQGEYVEVDEDRARRLAEEYAKMDNDPQNPKVKEAYAELIKQTKAQYQALVDAGYKFWFIDLNNPENIEYISSPYNAMRDLRQNKQMGVFPTEFGFGTDETVDVSKNPLLEDTGIMWASGGLDGEMKPVTANDLFRAVHDAFGHGLEGAGFRARGEENAWQAHVRLFTGSAVGAMTSETRGQNSWVNYGPNGEQNRNASAEDTVFADQKVGLMPEWTWTEGRAKDMEVEAETPTVSAATQGLSEAELPGYNRMINEVEGIVSKSKNRGVSEPKIAENVMNYVTGSKVYENATDVQREALVREVNKRFGIKEKAAPSANRILGKLKDITKITMSEKVALVKQIKDTARGAKDAAKALKTASQELTKEIKELAGIGKITLKQEANILRAFSKTNVLSETSVARFTDYMSKIFSDAEYASKLSEANSLKKQIKSLSKNQDKNANIRDLAQKFSEINPSLVENIDTYNEVASRIKEAIKGSTIKGQNVKFAETVNIDETISFIEDAIEKQDKKLREERIAEVRDLIGVDVSDLTNKQIEELLQKDKKFTGDDEKIVRAAINKAFDLYSSIVKEQIKTGEDVFTGEKIDLTKTQKEVVTKFMNMDLGLLQPKEALDAVDGLMNFLVNQSTAKMTSVVAKYEGLKNTKELANKGIKSRNLSKYFSKPLGRTLAEQVTPLPIVFEKMFPGFNRANMVMNKIGLTDLVNKAATSETQSRKIVNDYVNEFYDKKANGEAFNTDYNNVERGLSAFMMRSVMGTTEDIQIDFGKRKNLIEQSIDELSKGDERERAKVEVYQKAYDKILDGSKNAQEVIDKTDKTNLDAIKFWQDQWADKYEQMSDVSLNIYNTLLDKDLNFTPDRLSKISTDIGVVDLNDDASAFHGNNGSVLVDKTGSLKEIQRLKNLPKNEKTGKVSRYVDLSFDNNMSNAIYDALMDINTAEPIRQINSFLNSPDFRKVVTTAEDANLLVGRIKTYIKNKRGKNQYSNDELSKSIRQLNKVAAFGVNLALSGVTQPIKQTIPVALNTFINTGGRLKLFSTFNADKLAFINNSGYGIANRGAQSQVEIESLNKLIEKAATSKREKAMKFLEKANEMQLKLTLEKPDVFIAKASWLSYYEQSLRKQKIDTKNINYKTHKLNKEAADYAERMVTRQQNVNDKDLAGNLFTSKEATTQVLTKMLMSFASFRMNQASRVGADLITFQDKTSSVEDKKIAAASLSGYAAELVTFKFLSAGIALLLGTATMYMMGQDESEEEYEKRKNNTLKGTKTGIFVDLFSTIPLTDYIVQEGGAKLTKGIEELTGAPVSIYETPKQEWLRQYGTFGIAADRLNKLYNLGNLAATGTYKDDFGRVKEINEQDRLFLQKLVPFGAAASFGLVPTETQTVINSAVKFAKKAKKSTAETQKRDAKKQEEINILENLKQKSRTQKEIEAIDNKINEIKAVGAEREQIQQSNREEKEIKKQLLIDPKTGVEYDNESDLKKYNRRLWNKNFGPNSDWVKENKVEIELEKKLNKQLLSEEEKKYNYVAPKKRGRGRNSDGSYKSYSRVRRTYKRD